MTASEHEEILADHILDITKETCPMTFVRTRLALDRLPRGAVLHLLIAGAEPRRNIPLTAVEQGHAVLRQRDDPHGITHLWLRKG